MKRNLTELLISIRSWTNDLFQWWHPSIANSLIGNIITYIVGGYADLYYWRGKAELKLDQKDNGCLDLSKAGELGLSKAYDAIKHLCN